SSFADSSIKCASLRAKDAGIALSFGRLQVRSISRARKIGAGRLPELSEDHGAYFGGAVHAPTRDLYDLLCDDFRDRVIAIRKSKVSQQILVSAPHGFNGLGLERGVLQKAIDRHPAISFGHPRMKYHSLFGHRSNG